MIESSNRQYFIDLRCVLQIQRYVFSPHQTFNALLLLATSEKVNDVFWVGHMFHKLLAEARRVERLEASTVVHLGKVMKRMILKGA